MLIGSNVGDQLFHRPSMDLFLVWNDDDLYLYRTKDRLLNPKDEVIEKFNKYGEPYHYDEETGTVHVLEILTWIEEVSKRMNTKRKRLALVRELLGDYEREEVIHGISPLPNGYSVCSTEDIQRT